MKKTWKIDVPSCPGYSFAVRCDADTASDAIEMAAKADLFDDKYEANYASAEDISDDEYTLNAFKNCTTEI